MEKVMCSCDGKKCAGICRKKNLFRESRKTLKYCPSAYGNADYLHGGIKK